MHPQSFHYIPMGCVGITKCESGLSSETWHSTDHQSWKTFAWHNSTSFYEDGEVVNHEPYLNDAVQASLLRAPKLSPFTYFLDALWAKLEFRVGLTDDRRGLVRVYMLPDDVQRRTVDRSGYAPRKARMRIITGLDYSAEAWDGHRAPVENGELIPFDLEAAKAHEDVSLLQLFNTIPSPNPDPGSMLDPHTQDAMRNILESNIDGLITRLHSYQRRSAALMLQKEVQPGQVLDPRLLKLRDTQGSEWYIDPIAGVILLEPRYYDGASGGILAEEMGSGKTIICLSLILASRHLPTSPPEVYIASEPPVRSKLASLADMAASCATRNAVHWKWHFEEFESRYGYEFSRCQQILARNHGYYLLPTPEPRRPRRNRNPFSPSPARPLKKIYMTSTSLVIVPNDLVGQWKEEIQTHTMGFSMLVLEKEDKVPKAEYLLGYGIILMSLSRLEKMWVLGGQSALTSLHFKRCIVDEGHILSSSKIGNHGSIVSCLNAFNISSRWIVTGTPSRGLYGDDASEMRQTVMDDGSNRPPAESDNELDNSSAEMEKKDLERLGTIAAMYLKARPWANTAAETGDTVASWSKYLMLPRHNPKSCGRWDCLKSTIQSPIIRHPLKEISNLLPKVDERIIILDGSYQDQLSLNLFSMMIVFNSVQSQRTDMDYFFHRKQRKALLQLVHNLKQASFFGGSFFTTTEIAKSVQTAEGFLREKKVPISPEDKALLQEAIRFGHLAMNSKLKNLSNQFHEIAVCVTGFPSGAGQSWSLDGENSGDAICTSTSMLLTLQGLIYNAAGERGDLNSLLDERLIQVGVSERQKLLAVQTVKDDFKPRENKANTLAGNTRLGDDNAKKSRPRGVNGIEKNTQIIPDSLFKPLELTMVTSTISAKLKYLIDNIVKYQYKDKIIVFYENENVAWYLASMLDVLQIQHLIYAKGLTTERRAQYINTFQYKPQFRVLLMDLSQAAFGLDMRKASRIYFINPVLNPQVEAQAIGRVRRISQTKPIFVETLVLKNSIDEIILERKQHMTQTEHRRAKSIVDIQPIFNWVKNASVTPMEEKNGDYQSQMVELETPLPVLGRGFGRPLHPDEGLVLDGYHPGESSSPMKTVTLKRAYNDEPGGQLTVDTHGRTQEQGMPSPSAKRVRFEVDSGED